MSLTDRCARSFSKDVRSRGQLYQRQRRVLVTRLDRTGADADVHGSSGNLYSVSVDWQTARSGTLVVNCNCPYFSDARLCKHIWATLAELDNKRIQIPGSGPLQVLDQLIRDDDWLDEDFLGDEDADLDEGGGTEWEANSWPTTARRTQPALWLAQLEEVLQSTRSLEPVRQELEQPLSEKQQEAWFALHVTKSIQAGQPHVEWYCRERRRNGSWGTIKPLRLRATDLPLLADGDARHLLSLLWECRLREESSGYYYGYEPTCSASRIGPALTEPLIQQLCQSGRFVWILNGHERPDPSRVLTWDDEAAWRFRLIIEEQPAEKTWNITGQLYRENQCVDLKQPLLLISQGLVFFPDRVARLDARSHFAWIRQLRKDGAIRIPFSEAQTLLDSLWQMPQLPEILWPESLQYEQRTVEPQGQLSFLPPHRSPHRQSLLAFVHFRYGDHVVAGGDERAGLVDHAQRQCILRDRRREAELVARLREWRAERADRFQAGRWGEQQLAVLIPENRFADLIHQLTNEGWQIEAEGQRVRRPGQMKLSVTSSVDWFELDGQVDFGGVSVSLPQLLQAARRGERVIRLGDGSCGMLPQQWLQQYGGLAALGQAEGDSLRFTSSQAALLDALLDAQHVDLDGGFQQLRSRLQSFEGIKPKSPPRTFCGELRSYQRDGLGWLEFLRTYGLGGCLADDMGLGKTIQVLALLEQLRTRRKKDAPATPSLVVVPRSLVFNWIEEARRFTPNLRVLNYTGPGRKRLLKKLARYDLIVTTYGTLRRDILQLKEIPFEYAILDEAQAIKNASSQAAKAVRLLQAQHRLAMTGTPIENHLGELWSLFEFLNPGMLGDSEAFAHLTREASGSDDGQIELLRRGLRPYILRRTKSQVLAELPEKTEQTIYCEMGSKQRKLYEELRDFYRVSLLQRIDQSGLARSKMHVLEALLRLRQAACHPGLLDAAKQQEPSAKLDLLLAQLEEIVAEGHKALVFSQFTSLLAIVREHLEQRGLTYEYLDGRTRQRQARVQRFQEDPNCPLFLISLKAGGQGLNLTAADYVYILDPWWNPAVEAQAIDRAHRLGQTRRVFAYRFICRNTVEEKILELQESKRDLAEAIISADNSLLRKLTADDLKILLS